MQVKGLPLQAEQARGQVSPAQGSKRDQPWVWFLRPDWAVSVWGNEGSGLRRDKVKVKDLDY